MGFVYDANGRVVKPTKANTPDSHTVYDALGNRVAMKVNEVWQYVIYDAFGKLVAEYGTASGGMGGVKYIQRDHQGSVRTVTNAHGFVVSRTDHQAFGETIGSGTGLRSINQGYGLDSSTRQSYGLTESDDASGQQHTWFRKLETHAGRWSSPDPYKGSMSLGDPQSFNRYSYVGNQPTNYVDPSGLLWRLECTWSVTVGGSDWSGGCDSVRWPNEWRWQGYDPDRPPREPHGPARPDPPNETCTLTVNITKAGTSGSSSGTSGSSSGFLGTAGAQSGPYNHAYVTLRDSNAAYSWGYRAGPGGYGIPGVSPILAEVGTMAKGLFADFEPNPSGAVVETYNENCNALDKSFRDYVNKVNDQKITYSLIGTNSNAFVYSMLNAAGINAASFTPRLNTALGTTGSLPCWGYTLPLR